MEDMGRMEEYLDYDISIPDNEEVTEPMKIYLKEIGQIPLLGAEEEQALGKQIAAGNLGARDKLEEANLRLVVSVARHFTGQGIPFMDLIQEGNIGLMNAAEKFDYTKESRFSTYAIPWIKEAIIHAVDGQSEDMQVPAHVAESMQKVQKAQAWLKQDLGREATFGEIAGYLGDKSEEEVGHIMALLGNSLTLDARGEGDRYPDYGDCAKSGEDVPEAAVNSLIRQEEVAQLLEKLSETERQVIRLRFGLENGKAQTAEEAGERMEMSGEEIRQIEERAMGKLRAVAGKDDTLRF